MLTYVLKYARSRSNAFHHTHCQQNTLYALFLSEFVCMRVCVGGAGAKPQSGRGLLYASATQAMYSDEHRLRVCVDHGAEQHITAAGQPMAISPLPSPSTPKTPDTRKIHHIVYTTIRTAYGLRPRYEHIMIILSLSEYGNILVRPPPRCVCARCGDEMCNLFCNNILFCWLHTTHMHTHTCSNRLAHTRITDFVLIMHMGLSAYARAVCACVERMQFFAHCTCECGTCTRLELT